MGFGKIEGDPPQYGEIERGIVGPGTGAVCVEQDVHDPMQLIHDAPMGSYGRQQVPASMGCDRANKRRRVAYRHLLLSAWLGFRSAHAIPKL